MSVCPLCDKPIKKPKVVYGHAICKKCWSGYINRRQIAYVIDSLIIVMAMFVGGLALGLMFGANVTWGVFLLAALVDAIWLGRDALGGRSPGKACMNLETIDNSSGEVAVYSVTFQRFSRQFKSSFNSQ